MAYFAIRLEHPLKIAKCVPFDLRKNVLGNQKADASHQRRERERDRDGERVGGRNSATRSAARVEQPRPAAGGLEFGILLHVMMSLKES